MQRILHFLYQVGIDLKTFQVDTQQLIHVCRQEDGKKGAKVGGADDGKKRKKTDSLHLKPAEEVALYLSHKARFIGGGVQSQIIREPR